MKDVTERFAITTQFTIWQEWVRVSGGQIVRIGRRLQVFTSSSVASHFLAPASSALNDSSLILKDHKGDPPAIRQIHTVGRFTLDWPHVQRLPESSCPCAENAAFTSYFLEKNHSERGGWEIDESPSYSTRRAISQN